MTSQTDDWIGRDLVGGRYKIIRKLGEGGMGAVYEASDQTLGTNVVIKVPHWIAARDAGFSERFGREIRSLVELSHPHIVKVIDAGVHDGLPFAVMQFLAGGSLEDHLDINNSQPAEVSRWLEDVCKALDFVHTRNFLHRDIKPGNILFDEYGNVYLSDFGIAKALAATTTERLTTLTGTGMVLGTPEYMAPELILGNWVDGRADQYALAVTVYEMLSGRRPFEGANPTAVMVATSTQAPAPLQNYAPHLSRQVCLVINKALAKNTQDRYPDCLGFARAFNAAVNGGATPQDASAEQTKLPCPACGRLLRVPENFAGREVACPNCKSGLLVARDRSALVSKELRRGSSNVAAAASRQAVNAPPVTAILARPSSATTTDAVRPRRWQQPRVPRWLFIAGIGLTSVLVFIIIVMVTSPLFFKKTNEPPVAAEIAALSPKVPNVKNDARSRWIDVTYGGSIEGAGGGRWVRKDGNAGKPIEEYTETARSSEFVELFYPSRNVTYRLLTNTIQQMSNGKQEWEWLAFGYWSSPEREAEFIRLTTQSIPALRPDDKQIVWVNETYKQTWYRRADGYWDAKHTDSEEIEVHNAKELSRSKDFVELIRLNERYRVRLSSKSAEQYTDGKWQWCANGHWDTPASNLGGDDLYLSDLQETSVEIWRYRPWFGFGKNGTYVGAEDRKEKKIVLGGKESPKGIFALPKTNGRSLITYDLNGRDYTHFQATVGVADEKRYGPHTPLTFEVWGDGKLLWQSQPVKRWGEPQECSVALSKISQLELRVECPGDASFALAVWCEPRLTNRPSTAP